jgi:hypothetical protein
MKAYVRTTGSIFALLVAAHVWRIIVEGTRMLRDPWFVFFTLAAIGFAVWAWRLVRASPATS